MSTPEQIKDEDHRHKATVPVMLSPKTGLDDPVTFAFTRLTYNTWFEGRRWTDVFKLLIDSYRLRLATQRDLDGKPRRVPDEERREVANGLRRFLHLAEEVPGLLPQEWNWVHATRCKLLAGCDEDITNWYSLEYLPNEDEITEWYEDDFFSVQLQIFAKLVYGTDVAGQDAEILWGIMLVGEKMARGKDDEIPTVQTPRRVLWRGG
ncbi:hypothetical protein TOPH_05350 [Tolypocladium ophioglossoides CBS 100239]|uniref:Uncharacterized protein n=1 Tax=Tolypocladium ophioglossoides (strain CBS 100239) TaxID=1163406 RepID=A0A0L0N7N4_TOLOC|nr:hypothetical protein TOPH_05350 [Tolypocladium ophioglossoides CBS 100239]